MTKLDDMLSSSGIKALYDITMGDKDKIAELKKQEDNKLPIDIEMAEEVVRHIDLYMDGLAEMSWSNRMMLQQGKFKKIQKEAHDHLEILKEKAKTQGIVYHNIQQPQPETQISKEIQIEVAKQTVVSQSPIVSTEIKKEGAEVINMEETIPKDINELISNYNVTPDCAEPFPPIDKEGYINLTKIWNERLAEAATKAHELGQMELLNKMLGDYEGFGVTK